MIYLTVLHKEQLDKSQWDSDGTLTNSEKYLKFQTPAWPLRVYVDRKYFVGDDYGSRDFILFRGDDSCYSAAICNDNYYLGQITPEFLNTRYVDRDSVIVILDIPEEIRNIYNMVADKKPFDYEVLSIPIIRHTDIVKVVSSGELIAWTSKNGLRLIDTSSRYILNTRLFELTSDKDYCYDKNTKLTASHKKSLLHGLRDRYGKDISLRRTEDAIDRILDEYKNPYRKAAKKAFKKIGMSQFSYNVNKSILFNNLDDAIINDVLEYSIQTNIVSY